MTQDEVRELLNTFMIAVSKLVDAKSSGYVRSEICEVRFIDDLNVYVRPYSDVSTPTHISPSIVDDLDDGDIRIPNISGHALVAGDAVEILYTTNIEDAVIVRKVVYDPVDPGGGGGGGGGDIEPYTSNPHMDGTASPGSSSKYSRGDHVHPTDTSRMAANLKGAAGGVAELDASGKVPSSQLPGFVDDVIEGYLHSGKFYEEAAHTTEIAAEAGKIYVDLATEKTYRWSGSAYVEISSSLALGETSSTAYRGDRGKAAYDHSQLTSGNPHNVTKSDVGLGNVDNTSDSTKKSNFTGSIADGNTGFVTGDDVYDALGATKDYIDTAIENITGTVKTASGIIAPNATTTTVSFSGTFINAYATMGGSIVVVDISIGASSVTFTVANEPSAAITCVVAYI